MDFFHSSHRPPLAFPTVALQPNDAQVIRGRAVVGIFVESPIERLFGKIIVTVVQCLGTGIDEPLNLRSISRPSGSPRSSSAGTSAAIAGVMESCCLAIFASATNPVFENGSRNPYRLDFYFAFWLDQFDGVSCFLGVRMIWPVLSFGA